LLVSKGNLDSNSIRLVRKAVFIADSGNVRLYKLPLDSLQPAYEKTKRCFPYKKFRSGKLYISNNTAAVFSNSFENSDSRIFNFSKGALQKPSGSLEIFKGKINADSNNQQFEVSLWVYAKTDTFFPSMIFRQYNTKQERISEVFINPKFFTEIRNNWIRINHYFILTEKENSIEVIMDGNSILVDDLLIRPVNTDVGESDQDHLIFNNNYIPANSMVSVQP
jgi:hypothetical protein